MYPSFVTVAAGDKCGARILIICGKEYKASPYDRYIDEAIALASHWPPHQVTHDRIVHLHIWIRENVQHAHNIPYKHLPQYARLPVFCGNGDPCGVCNGRGRGNV